MIYVDSCIPMYLIGKDHPNKRRIMDLVSNLIYSHEVLITSTESFQEIIHRYKAIKDFKHLQIAYSALDDIVLQIEDVKKVDVDESKNYAIQYEKLSSRDCLHLAVMKRIKCDSIWTYDTGFDNLPSITRIY
jgi:predicted nucleic acid-binding protein